MEEEKTKSAQCFRCKYFIRYYTQGVTEFQKTDFGRCGKQHKIVNMHDGCGQYLYKQKTKIFNGFICRHLNNLLTELSSLRKFIETKNDESKEL